MLDRCCNSARTRGRLRATRWLSCVCVLWGLTGCQVIRGALSGGAEPPASAENTDNPSPSSLRKVPAEAYAHYVNGMLHMQRDQWAEAARSMEKVAELDPGSERAIQRLAICYLRMQKKEKMIEQFAKLSKLRPADFAMHYDLGRLYENEGMTEEAIREYEAARELFDPEKPHTETAMALMLERLAQLYQAEKQIEEAEKCYRQIMDVQPAVDRAALFMSIGRLNYLGERWQKAADAFEEAAKQKPDLPEARKYLAFCYDEMKDYERAIIEAKKCLQKKLFKRP